MKEQFKRIKEISLDPVRKDSFGPWAFFMLLFILPFFSMIAYLLTSNLAEKQEQNIDGRFLESMEITAQNKVRNINKWLEEAVLVTNRITHSRIIQMFTMDVNESEQGEDFNGPLEQRRLYIEEVLSTFVAQQQYIEKAYLINRRAQIFVGVEEAIDPSQGYNTTAREVFMNRQLKFSPLRMDGERMLMDVYIPIFSLKDFEEKNKRSLTVNGKWEETNQVAGVLIVTISVKGKLIEFMEVKNEALEGQHIYLFQEISGGVEMIRLNKAHEGIFSQDKDAMAKEVYKEAWAIYNLREQGKHDLSKIPKFGTQSNVIPRPGEILMLKAKLKTIPLSIMIYLELNQAYQDLLLQRRQLHFIGQLIAILLFVFILALWWKMQDVKHVSMAKQYREFSKKINAQRHLLMSINGAVKEHISLKYFDGKYVYANEAFCHFISLKEHEVLGKNDADIFGEKVAEELKEMDKNVLKSKKAVFEDKSFIIKDKRYYLNISKTPFLDGNKKFVGITTVVKDLTEITQERQLREKAMKNSMRSMMRIMQRHDDHLVKHAKYLKTIVLELSEKLGLDHKEITTLEICANLSQIGKIYVPKNILTATGALNDKDLITYRAHIEDTAFILDTVDWGLPVVHTVYAMHEKLDGSGYPNGLSASDITRLSRIMAVCDRFCKLVCPRRGFKVYTPEEAIKWMVNQKGKYDLSIIQTLAEMITDDEAIVLVG